MVTDHQGTPREIFSEKGIVSWAGRLNTWGQMAFWQSHDNYADNDPEYTECHFRFAGQYEDKEVSQKMYINVSYDPWNCSSAIAYHYCSNFNNDIEWKTFHKQNKG